MFKSLYLLILHFDSKLEFFDFSLQKLIVLLAFFLPLGLSLFVLLQVFDFPLCIYTLRLLFYKTSGQFLAARFSGSILLVYMLQVANKQSFLLSPLIYKILHSLQFTSQRVCLFVSPVN